MSLTKLQLEILEENARTNVVEVIRNGEIFHIDEDTKNSLAYKKALMDKELEKFLEIDGFVRLAVKGNIPGNVGGKFSLQMHQ